MKPSIIPRRRSVDPLLRPNASLKGLNRREAIRYGQRMGMTMREIAEESGHQHKDIGWAVMDWLYERK